MKRIALLTAVLLLCTAACEAQTPVPVRAVRLDRTGAGEQRHYFGAVQGSQRVNLSFRVPGPLVEFPVETGSRVKKGQLIARIDPRDFRTRLSDARSQMAQASARYSQAQSNFRRYDELYKKQVVSQAQYDQFRTALDVARSSLRTAEAGVSAAQNALADTELRAPFAGVIVARMAEKFQDVQPMQPVVSLQNLENVEIVVNVPEEDVANLAVSGRDVMEKSARQLAESISADLSVAIDALPGKSYKAAFKEISAQSNPRTRTYPATVVMPQPDDARILPGMSVLVTVRLPVSAAPSSDAGYAVPLEALVGDVSGSCWLWRCSDDGTIEKVAVTPGEFRGSSILVTGSLKEGDLIVTAGARDLREGQTVKVID